MEYANPTSLVTKMPKLTFVKNNLTFQLKEGTELVRVHYLDPSIPLKFGCRDGHCGTCAIKVVNGEENLSPKTKQEKTTIAKLGLSSSHRLACQCALKGDVIIDC